MSVGDEVIEALLAAAKEPLAPADPGAAEQRAGPAWDGERSRYDARGEIPGPRSRQLDPVIDLGWKHVGGAAAAMAMIALATSGFMVQWNDYQAEKAKTAVIKAKIAAMHADQADGFFRDGLSHEFLYRSSANSDLVTHSTRTTPAAEFHVAEEKLVSFTDGSREIFSIDAAGNVELGPGVTPDQASRDFWKLVKVNQPR